MFQSSNNTNYFGVEDVQASDRTVIEMENNQVNIVLYA